MPARPGFNQNQVHHVRKVVKFNGHTFQPDDVFTWRQIGCSVRRLRQLYEMGKLCYKVEEPEDDFLDESELLNSNSDLELDSSEDDSSGDPEDNSKDNSDENNSDEDSLTGGEQNQEGKSPKPRRRRRKSPAKT